MDVGQVNPDAEDGIPHDDIEEAVSRKLAERIAWAEGFREAVDRIAARRYEDGS